MSLPVRLYTPNIEHNPLHWMGIWTPQGWRVHAKRWGQAQRFTKRLSGDGRTTFFPEVLRDPHTGAIAWGDDLHVTDDPVTDGGIYPCDPRVEYPAGRPRWAISHTLLCYPVADHTLLTHEYTWDLEQGHLQTHFRRHVALERARTDGQSGRTVTVAHTPISTVIEGNVCYPQCNSAVRGVWSSADKSGPNYYTRRVCELLSMANGVYVTAPHTPVVQCYGLYLTDPTDPLTTVFDLASGECLDRQRLMAEMHVPLDAPKLGMIRLPARKVWSDIYDRVIELPAATVGEIPTNYLDQLAERYGARFRAGEVGYAAAACFDGDTGAAGYVPAFDFNNNDEIDADDLEFLRRNLGRRVRYNLYLDAYFGGDWLSTYYCVEPEHRPGTPLIADYEYGGGYDSAAGVIHLLETPGPDQPVWVEYFYDAPAEAGEDDICVHLYREENS